MMTPVIRSHLSAVLDAHQIKPYGLAKRIKTIYGEAAISQPTVYAIAANKTGAMPDSRTLNQVITALRDLTGKELQVGDLFDYVPDPVAP